MTADCVHGDDPAVCPPCQDEASPRPVAAASRWRDRRTFTAAFHGRCAACDEPIESGEAIRAAEWWVGTDYVHEGCAT